MAETLKTGLGVRYLLPILSLYAVAAALIGPTDADLVRNVVQHVSAAGVAGLIILVFQDLAPPSVKGALVFWRIREILPGHRAFTLHALKDPRVDADRLTSLLPPAMDTGAQQNALWYRWFKEVESEPSITDAHRRYLALRDCTVLLALLTLLSPVLGLVDVQTWPGAFKLTGVCAVGYLLVMFAARNAAHRFVRNVVACKVSAPGAGVAKA
ncbi:MAG: hypothetical protein J0I52_01660 [Bordetella sp.]|nr:hypothetical protein [Bordetella sp.]